MNHKRIIQLLLLMFSSSCTYNKNSNNKDVENELSKEDLHGYKFTHILPINATVKPMVSLSVNIPRGFYSLQKNMQEPMIEYVAEAENGNNWTKIITTQMILGKQVSSQEFINAMRETIVNNASNIKVIEHSKEEHKDYSSSKLIIIYTYKKRKEVLLASYFSGPLDCSGFQYTIALSNNMSMEAALNTLNEFAKQNTRIIIH